MIKNMLLASVALATAPLLLAVSATPAAAQSKLGIAVVNVDAAIGQSAAAQTATQQMQVTYKAAIDSVNARQTALQTELKQKQDALQAAVTAAGAKPTPAQQTKLQGDYDALQRRAQEAQAELQQLQQPLQLARSYVVEQIAAKLEDALKNVMTKNKVDLLLKGSRRRGVPAERRSHGLAGHRAQHAGAHGRHRAAAGLASGRRGRCGRRSGSGCSGSRRPRARRGSAGSGPARASGDDGPLIAHGGRSGNGG